MPELCLLQANCQGEVLELLLSQSAFAKHFTVKRYLNYTREVIPEEELASCRLFLYQHLGEHFGDLASNKLLARLGPRSTSLELPNLFFKGYWPFWTNAIKVIEFANELLEHLLDLGLTTKEILQIYLQGSHPWFNKVAEIAEQSLERERAKEAKAEIKCAKLIASYWREEALFFTVNHPGTRLSLYVANSLLSLLGYPPLPKSLLTSFVHPESYFCLPIHPQVGKILRLNFTGSDVRYPIFQSALTHREFVIAYLSCRLNREEHLLSFLRKRGETNG
ncbi:MAG: hypothetical protein IJS50_00625 [Desulfovibrio sp.]|nr:hypothetical protein [Desulfovibrio sp.]